MVIGFKSDAVSYISDEQHLTTGFPLNDEWNKTFGGNKSDCGYSVKQTNDGGNILTGYTKSFGAGNQDVWLIKTDENGNEQWNKTYGGPDWDIGNSLEQTPDGGYILIGLTKSFGAGSFDVWMIKADSDGNEEWNKTYGGTDYDEGLTVHLTTDSGYIIVGLTYSFGKEEAWVIKTDSGGNEEWNTTSPTWNVYEYRPGGQTEDGGFIITGEIYHSYNQSFDAFLMKLDANGNVEWNKTYGGVEYDEGWAVRQTNDSGFIITGATKSYSASSYDVWLIKTDTYGNEEWNKTFDTGNLEIGYSVQQTKDE